MKLVVIKEIGYIQQDLYKDFALEENAYCKDFIVVFSRKSLQTSGTASSVITSIQILGQRNRIKSSGHSTCLLIIIRGDIKIQWVHLLIYQPAAY